MELAKALALMLVLVSLEIEPHAEAVSLETSALATHSTVILGLVPRIQPSAREKRGYGRNTAATSDRAIIIWSLLHDGSSGQARG
jgi:hypothetical protein